MSVGGSVAGDEVLFGLVLNGLLELVIQSFSRRVVGPSCAPVTRH